jgi:hypothetical protein
MRNLILILGTTFFIGSLISVNYGFWPEMLIAGMSGVCIGVGVGGKNG